MNTFRDVRKYIGYQRLSSGDLVSDDDSRDAGGPSDPAPQLSDYIIIESRKSQVAPIDPVVPRGSHLTKSSSSSFEDDELWTVTVDVDAGSMEKTSGRLSDRKSIFRKEEIEKELEATKANLQREQKKREQLEESLRRLKTKTGRSASTISEPGCIVDTISPKDLLYAYTNELTLRVSSQLQLDGRDYLIEKMRRAHSDDESEPVEAWFDISTSQNGRNGWHRRYIALSATKLLFYESPEDFLQKKPSRVIRLDMLITVRNIITDTEGRISIANSNAQWYSIRTIESRNL
ncbi:rho-associated protein kinase 2 [Galendromus occidentalis]|uniref:Rho-associated protein kinase 2 n=1 Tax=Galendromus occidentalis TaxID=34638 RepID=A0AAJ6VXQ5_9ACAR|nr:rho-associated protein kinase 2 [Galendromus occidentalis]